MNKLRHYRIKKKDVVKIVIHVYSCVNGHDDLWFPFVNYQDKDELEMMRLQLRGSEEARTLCEFYKCLFLFKSHMVVCFTHTACTYLGSKVYKWS